MLYVWRRMESLTFVGDMKQHSTTVMMTTAQNSLVTLLSYRLFWSFAEIEIPVYILRYVRYPVYMKSFHQQRELKSHTHQKYILTQYRKHQDIEHSKLVSRLITNEER